MQFEPTGESIQTGLRGTGFLNCESRVQAKDVVRGSRRRKAMKTSLVRRIEIGAMLCGHWYNTNRMAVWPDRSRLIHVRQGGPSQTTVPS